MKGFADNRYFISTLVLVTALVAYFSFSQQVWGPRAKQAIGQTNDAATEQLPDNSETTGSPEDGTSSTPPPQNQANQTPLWVTVAAILAAGGLLTLLIARLQRRRSEAYQRAALEQRDAPRRK